MINYIDVQGIHIVCFGALHQQFFFVIYIQQYYFLFTFNLACITLQNSYRCDWDGGDCCAKTNNGSVNT